MSNYKVTSNSIPNGTYYLKDEIFFTDNCLILLKSINECRLISETHSIDQSTKGKLAGGILGLAVAGPLGAVAGLIVGGKKNIDEIDFFCKLDDGRSFVARCNSSEYSEFQTQFSLNNKKESFEEKIASEDISLNSNIKEQKNCPSCDEIIKLNARKCRFCDHKFNLVEGPIFESGFLDFKMHFDRECLKYKELHISDKDLQLTFYIARAINNVHSRVSENYSIKKTADFFASNWSDGFEDNDGETPDQVYARLSKQYDLGYLLNSLFFEDSDQVGKVNDHDINSCAIEAIEEFKNRFS